MRERAVAENTSERNASGRSAPGRNARRGKEGEGGQHAFLTKNTFAVLDCVRCKPEAKQQEIAQTTGLSIGTVNGALKQLTKDGLIEVFKVQDAIDEAHASAASADADSSSQSNSTHASAKAAAASSSPSSAGRTPTTIRRLTPAGEQALAPYKVDNAIIMAAGLSTRFAPISYEKPKGLLNVRGEILIERLIEQLQEAGIEDIVVVVGYKQEAFFYLEDKYNATIVVNHEFASRNNNSSLYAVRDRLGNSLICSSDDYYVSNPFSRYEWGAYYSAEYSDGPTREWCMSLGPHNRIKEVTIGGSDSLYMIGHAYFDRDFSEKFRRILVDEYDLPQTADKLWEELYIDHIDDLPMAARTYGHGAIYEFDSLDELREFDPFFLENVDSAAFDNITATLGCTKSEIHDIFPLKQGLTNLSCHFRTNDGEYVYRHPGVGTEQLVDRSAEAKALKLAKQMGIDDTFIFADPKKGWKLSRYITNARLLDPRDDVQLGRAMEIARKLHESDATIDREFDFYNESKRYEAILRREGPIDVAGYAEMATRMDRLYDHVQADDSQTCLCHNDFFHLNLLLDEDDAISLIDWEYAGMSDYANDFGTFTVTSQLTETEARRALDLYFERSATPEEVRHNFAFVAFAGWCWYVWSLVKESEGDNVGEWLYIYYKYAKEYLEKALALYEA